MPSWSADIQSQINVAQTYQHETFTFLRYCEHYIVGYSTHGVQIIKGKCHYGGIRDLGGDTGGHYPVDLPAWVGGVVTSDLTAEIEGLETTQTEDLGGIIGAHQPRDLGALIDMHDPRNLGAYIRGFAFRDLGAMVGVMQDQDLPAELLPIPPEDLSAYLKVWPQEDLPGFLYGWDTKDLGGYIIPGGFEDLPAEIRTHGPRNLRALVKGWVREATHDLGALIHAFAADDLGAFIRATEMAQLPAYLFAIAPKNLRAFIHGWDTKDLGCMINGTAWPWDLSASITPSGSWRDLSAEIVSKKSTALSTDLSAYILVTQGRDDLPAMLLAKQARDLGAFIDTGKDMGDLPASIYPKRIRLTGVLSLVTMEHSDLSATISIPCFFSNLSDLSSYINPVFKAELGAYINPKGYVWAQSNLSASIGYTLNTVVQDKLIININIAPLGYRTEDKYTISLSMFRSGLNLGASITATRHPRDLSASINAVDVLPYDFETWKGKERVFDRTYTQVIRDYEDVDISFQTIVKDYFYSSGSDVVAKVDKYTHFVTKVASYYSPATSRRLNKKLHKVKYLYDTRHFADVDEAMRFAIWYVTTDPERDLGAYINSIAPMGSSDISARIGATRHYSVNNNLTSTITGIPTHSYDVAVGYEDDGVDYLEF